MFENIRADYAVHRTWRNRALWALVVYRFGRWSLQQKFPPWRWLTSKIYGVSNIISEIITGMIMDRQVRVGKGFHVIHPEGVRIHPETVIGDRVGILHGVTIAYNMYPGAPVIGNDVFIGANATIIGKIKIGDGARIAANTLVITDIPPGVTAIGVPARIMRFSGTRHRGRRDDSGQPGKGAADKVTLKQIASSQPQAAKDPLQEQKE